MAPNDSNKNQEIEVLRGVAVILTVLSHLPILWPFHSELLTKIYFQLWNPWPGVDLFFCISGFVVSKSYMELFDARRQQGLEWLAVQSFFIRRAYRLFPSAWLWALLGLVCSIFFNHSGVFASWFYNLRSMAVILTFSGNYANHFGLLLHPNDVYWSLALEEQFYFLFPLFLFFVKAPQRRIILLLALIAFQFFIDRNPFGTRESGFLSSFRLDAIMWGIVIHLFSRSAHYWRFQPEFLRSKVKKVIVCLVLLYLLVSIPAQLISMPNAVGLIALVAALLVLFASFNSGYIPKIPVVTPLLIWAGARSYGIYLIHVFSYRFVYEAFSRYAEYVGVPLDTRFTWHLLFAAIVVVLILADINYRLIEVPLRKHGAQIARQREQQILAGIQG